MSASCLGFPLLPPRPLDGLCVGCAVRSEDPMCEVVGRAGILPHLSRSRLGFLPPSLGMTFLKRQLLACKPHGPRHGNAWVPDLTHCMGLQSTAELSGSRQNPRGLLSAYSSLSMSKCKWSLHSVLYYFSVCLVVGMLVPVCSFSEHAEFCSAFCPSTWQAMCLREDWPS